METRSSSTVARAGARRPEPLDGCAAGGGAAAGARCVVCACRMAARPPRRRQPSGAGPVLCPPSRRTGSSVGPGCIAGRTGSQAWNAADRPAGVGPPRARGSGRPTVPGSCRPAVGRPAGTGGDLAGWMTNRKLYHIPSINIMEILIVAFGSDG